MQSRSSETGATPKRPGTPRAERTAMAARINTIVRVYPDVETLNHAVATSLADQIRTVVSSQAQFSLALAGGSTPRTLYRVLARDCRDTIPWTRVHLFWGDERYVPRDDPRSNYRLVRETLLDGVAIPPEQVHPIPTDFPTPDEAALAYERTLRAHFPDTPPRFDLILLGMGADGHTASLFPHSPAVEERTRLVVAVRAPVEPAVRLTLTLPVLNAAVSVFFLVTGEEKAEMLRSVLSEPPDAVARPASAIRPADGTLVWWADEAAARLVPTSIVRVDRK